MLVLVLEIRYNVYNVFVCAYMYVQQVQFVCACFFLYVFVVDVNICGIVFM